jgi:hypothetical protein
MNPLFTEMYKLFERLVDRLAPASTQALFVKFNPNNHTSGVWLDPIRLQTPFNHLLVNVISGNIEMYFGSPDKTNPPLPDFTFTQTGNLLPVPFQKRTDQVITFRVAVGSAAARGTIVIGNY